MVAVRTARQAATEKKGELSIMDSYQLCASRSPLQIFEMRMCCLLISKGFLQMHSLSCHAIHRKH